jgi:predicted GIY-YIG superfamily endonuclease
MHVASRYRVYVIQNHSGRYYIGVSDDVDHRVAQHNEGVSKWTRGERPLVTRLDQ